MRLPKTCRTFINTVELKRGPDTKLYFLYINHQDDKNSSLKEVCVNPVVCSLNVPEIDKARGRLRLAENIMTSFRASLNKKLALQHDQIFSLKQK